MITVAVLRHTEAVFSEAAYLPDDDRVLTERGRRQAAALASVVRSFAPDRVWCSDLRRAHETWDVIRANICVDAVVHPGLRERRFRSLEGLSLPELIDHIGPSKTALARMSTDLLTLPGEESIADAARRVVTTLREIVAKCAAIGAGRALIVSHGGPSSWLMCHLLDVPLERGRIFTHGLGRFHVLRLGPDLTLAGVAALNCADPSVPAAWQQNDNTNKRLDQ
ncbi:histidine phosphatase family protein [Frankia sp. B2]|uniref:histidine phosphatase family protein n=1 Tax=Frankia sp. B2 TaxID=2541730 RepID=UPI00141B6474|nr:histidine phosphatase family protein [Frankia sp. B2]